jgi:hypothetical protein
MCLPQLEAQFEDLFGFPLMLKLYQVAEKLVYDLLE